MWTQFDLSTEWILSLSFSPDDRRHADGHQMEFKSKQWFGASVRSDGEHILVRIKHTQVLQWRTVWSFHHSHTNWKSSSWEKNQTDIQKLRVYVCVCVYVFSRRVLLCISGQRTVCQSGSQWGRVTSWKAIQWLNTHHADQVSHLTFFLHFSSVFLFPFPSFIFSQVDSLMRWHICFILNYSDCNDNNGLSVCCSLALMGLEMVKCLNERSVTCCLGWCCPV